MKTFEQWLKAKGFELDTLEDEKKKTLRAQYDAEMKGEGGSHEPAGEPETKEEPKPQPAVPPVQASGNQDVDPIGDFRRQMSAETKRVEAIRKLCGGKHSDIEAKAIEEGWDETTTELHVLRASRPRVPSISVPQQASGPAVLEAAALMTSGKVETQRLEKLYKEPVLEAADKLRGIGIQEFFELACGQHLPRYQSDAIGWLQASFSTNAISGILSNIADKMLLEGYNYAENEWRKVAAVGTVNDFKQHSRYRMTSDFEFLKVAQDGELKHGSVSEQTYTQQADTYGIMFALTRQMIINDDLGAFAQIPFQIGLGAGEAITDAIWTLLLSNPSSFFASGNSNYLTGATTALGVASLTSAKTTFMEQTKPNGRPLGVRPRILLVPIQLETTARTLMDSEKIALTTTKDRKDPDINPHRNTLEVVSSAYLSNSSFSGYSEKAWYLFADPNRLAAMEVAFLNGKDRPTVEKADADFNVLGVQFRGYIDFGVAMMDYRAAVKVLGEAAA